MFFFLRVLFFVLSLVPLLFMLVLYTEQGTALGVLVMRNLFMPEIHYQSLEGRLSDTLSFKDLRYQSPTRYFSAKDLSIRVDLPSLLKGSFSAKELKIASDHTQFTLHSDRDPQSFDWQLKTLLEGKPFKIGGTVSFTAGTDPWQLTLHCEKTNIPIQQGILLEELALLIHPSNPSVLQISGQARISQEKIFIKAIADLQLHYLDHPLAIDGTVHIPEANIIVHEYQKNLHLSEDVVIQKTHNALFKAWKCLPTITVLLGNQFHIKTPTLDATLGGKLKIHQRKDGFLAAYGRVRIVEGQYRLQGRTQFIRQGSLLFPKGTLINNPLLDIQIHSRRFSQTDSEKDSLYVQGTLQQPLIQFYNKEEHQNTTLLSDLGLNDTEKEGVDNQQQVMAQTALLLSGQANPVTRILESGFGIESFNLESRSIPNPLGNPTHDTAVILGRPLSPKLYLEYVQTVIEPLSTLRLKYALSPQFSTSVESNTEGFGGDLTWSIEGD